MQSTASMMKWTVSIKIRFVFICCEQREKFNLKGARQSRLPQTIIHHEALGDLIKVKLKMEFAMVTTDQGPANNTWCPVTLQGEACPWKIMPPESNLASWSWFLMLIEGHFAEEHWTTSMMENFDKELCGGAMLFHPNTKWANAGYMESWIGQQSHQRDDDKQSGQVAILIDIVCLQSLVATVGHPDGNGHVPAALG